MNQEPIDYLSDRIPIGITREMVYKAVINNIYYNVLIFGNDIKTIVDTNSVVLDSTRGSYLYKLGLYGGPLTTGEATNYFIEQYMGDA